MRRCAQSALRMVTIDSFCVRVVIYPAKVTRQVSTPPCPLTNQSDGSLGGMLRATLQLAEGVFQHPVFELKICMRSYAGPEYQGM